MDTWHFTMAFVTHHHFVLKVIAPLYLDATVAKFFRAMGRGYQDRINRLLRVYAQAKIAEVATAIDAAALLVYRAAWLKDQGAPRVTREASMAKLFATESAQGVIDKAVQLHGGEGVRKGVKVEELYRDIRALRIYEGTSEIQKLVIARQTLKPGAARG